MKTFVALSAAVISVSAMCQTQALPRDVRSFLAGRNTCEHFLGEVDEGNTPERAQRQSFVSNSIDIYCAGTDKRLAALKWRYRNNAQAMQELKRFEDKFE